MYLQCIYNVFICIIVQGVSLSIRGRKETEMQVVQVTVREFEVVIHKVLFEIKKVNKVDKEEGIIFLQEPENTSQEIVENEKAQMLDANQVRQSVLELSLNIT